MCGAILPLCLLQAILLAVSNSQPAVLPDFSAARQRMVQEQLSAPGRDIKNRLVLDAMATVSSGAVGGTGVFTVGEALISHVERSTLILA